MDWSSVLTLAYPTTAMVRSMLKVWQTGLQPRSRPFPNYRWSDGIFKPCACRQPSVSVFVEDCPVSDTECGEAASLDKPGRRTGTHEPADHEDHAVGHSPDGLGQLDDFPHDDLEISISRSSELRHLPWGSMVSEVVTPLCRA